MDERRRNTSAGWRDDGVVISGQIIPLTGTYRLLLPREIYSHGLVVVMFETIGLMDYSQLNNAHLIRPSAHRGGNALIYFTDSRNNMYGATLAAEDYKLLSDPNIREIVVADLGVFKDGHTQKNTKKLKLWEREF